MGRGSDKKEWLTEDIMNDSIMFFFVGYSTISSLIQFVLYALALHQHVQEKLREEIGKIIKGDGTLDYDDIGKSVYLDMVICETLRLFPGVRRLERQCVQEYRDPELGLVIPIGALVAIPVQSYHYSKEFYENLQKFDPEHFSAENKRARNPYSYLPWGSGPRKCIGMRFAQIEVKSAVAHIIHNFLIEPTSNNPVPIQRRPIGFNTVSPKYLELKLTLLHKV